MQGSTATLGHRARAFTVIEILIAVTIFSLISVVVFSVFRTAVRTQATSQRETEMLERSRFVMDSLDRDFTNLFFRDETAYNVTVSNMIQKMEQERLRAEETGDWSQFEAQFGRVDEEDRDRSDKDEDEAKPTIGNPYEKGRIIDLQFKAQDSGVADKINFAVADRLGVGTPYQPWGLSRVEYSVEKGWLMRREQSVETEKRDLRGEGLGFPTPPQVTKLAEGVEEFDLAFAFWFDSTWYEIGAWDSSNRQIRNARQILGEYESEELSHSGTGEENRNNNGGTALRPGDPGWNEYLNDLDSEPLDRLPAYIRVRLVMAAPESPSRKYLFQRIFRLGLAEETWTPGKELDEDQRDSEQSLRDEKYRRIRPGVTRPR